MTDGVLELRWARRKEPHLVAKKKPQLEHTKKAQATADARVHSLFATTMAAAPLAAGATPGTTHTTTTTTTTVAHSITTYTEHYATLPDDLQGHYDLLLAPYDPASSRSHRQLLHRLLSMSDTSPKAFVGLVEHSRSYCTVLVHRITLFKSHPMLPGRCSPGKRCHTFWNRNIVLLPIVLGKVSCVPENPLCVLYGVKF